MLRKGHFTSLEITIRAVDVQKKVPLSKYSIADRVGRVNKKKRTFRTETFRLPCDI